MPDAPLDRTEFQRWREESDRALESARRVAAAGTHNWSCFLGEQAAQLAVKALLHGLGGGPWGHDLVELVGKANAADVPVPGAVSDATVRLARSYIAARYPDAHAGGAPSRRYVESDSASALADAEVVIAWVDRSWEALNA